METRLLWYTLTSMLDVRERRLRSITFTPKPLPHVHFIKSLCISSIIWTPIHYIHYIYINICCVPIPQLNQGWFNEPYDVKQFQVNADSAYLLARSTEAHQHGRDMKVRTKYRNQKYTRIRIIVSM